MKRADVVSDGKRVEGRRTAKTGSQAVLRRKESEEKQEGQRAADGERAKPEGESGGVPETVPEGNRNPDGTGMTAGSRTGGRRGGEEHK